MLLLVLYAGVGSQSIGGKDKCIVYLEKKIPISMQMETLMLM